MKVRFGCNKLGSLKTVVTRCRLWCGEQKAGGSKWIVRSKPDEGIGIQRMKLREKGKAEGRRSGNHGCFQIEEEEEKEESAKRKSEEENKEVVGDEGFGGNANRRHPGV